MHHAVPIRSRTAALPSSDQNLSTGQEFVLASWARAVDIFNSELINDEKKKITNFEAEKTVFSDLHETALSTAKTLEQNRSPWASKVKKLVDIIVQSGKVQDSLLALAPYSEYTTLALGAFRYLLKFVTEESSTAEALTAGLECILPIILRAEQYARLYSSHSSQTTERVFESLQENITRLFAEALNFLIRASIFFKTSSFRRHVSAALKPFATKFTPVLQKIKRYEESAKADIDVLRIDIEIQQEEYANGTWLLPQDSTSTLEALQRNTAPDTCSWFLNYPVYMSWKNTSEQASPLTSLWIQGRLGCGKSTIAANVVRDLQASKENNVITMICNSGRDHQDTLVGIFRTCIFLMIQASTNSRAAHTIVQAARHGSKTAFANQMNELWTIFDHLLPIIGTTYFIIDGLDECSNSLAEKKEFLTRFEKIIHSQSQKNRLIVFSRLQAVDPIWLESWCFIEIESSDTSPDVQRYIEHAAKTSRVLQRHKLRDQIQEHLLQHAEGVILWAKLMIQGLDSNKWSVENVLATPPRDMFELYSVICKQLTNDHHKAATILDALRIVCTTFRSLRLEELLLAIALRQGLDTYEDYDTLGDPEKDGQALVESCSPLLFLTPNHEVVLCHSSLKEFLLAGPSVVSEPLAARPNYQFDIRELHTSITLLLVKYLTFDCFNDDLQPFAVVQRDHSDAEVGMPGLAATRSLPNSVYDGAMITKPAIDDDLLDPLLLSYEDIPKHIWSEVANEYAREHVLEGHEKSSLGPIYFKQPLLEYATKHLAHHILASIPSSQTSDTVAGFFRSHYGWFWLLRLERDFGFKNEDLDPIQFKLYKWFLGSSANIDDLMLSKNLIINLKEQRYTALSAANPDGTSRRNLLTMFQLMNTLIYSYQHLGRHNDTERICVKLIQSAKQELGDDFAPVYYDVGNLGLLKQKTGHLKEAEDLFSESASNLERLLGADHPQTLIQRVHLANVHVTMGQFKEGEHEINQAVELATNRGTEKHSTTQMALLKQADIFGRVGKNAEAQEIYEHILDIRREVYGENHPKTLSILDDLATCLEAQKRLGDAAELRRRQLENLKDLLGPSHSDVLNSISSLATVVDEMGDFQAAEKLYLEAIDLAIENLGEAHPDTMSLMANLAGSLWSERSLMYRSRTWEALKLAILVLQRRQDNLVFDASATLSSAKDIAVLLQHHGQYEPALKIWDFVCIRRQSLLGDCHEDTISAMESRAETLNAMGREEEAAKIAQELLRIRGEQFGEKGVGIPLNNPLFMSSFKIWYQIHFKNVLSKETKKSMTEEKSIDVEDQHEKSSTDPPQASERVQSSEVGEEISAWWPANSVWHIEAHKSLDGDSIITCFQVVFWGFDEVPEQPLKPFRKKFRLTQDYFGGDLADGMYRTYADPSEPGMIIWKRIKIPYENVLVTVALGEDLSIFDKQMSALPEEHSDARRWPAKGLIGHQIAFGGAAEDIL